MPASAHARTARTDPAVVVPVYRPLPSPIERFTLRWSLGRLARRRRLVLTGPEGLDLGHYHEMLGPFDWLPFAPASFASIPGYSRLLTSHAFHDAFDDHAFVLLLQTDALLLRDDLDDWCAAPFDYVGAPWPTGVEILLQLDRFSHGGGQRVKAHVGNGGFSLRRVRACRDLLDEFPQALAWFQHSGSSEDLFFALMGSVSDRFVLPNAWRAARFARELQPRLYHAVHGAPPTGGHAWWKHDAAYWVEQIGRLDATAADEAAALATEQAAETARRQSPQEAAPALA